MTLAINSVEFVWVTLNVLTLAFTITAYFDARADRTAVRLLNGKARELAASGIVRRESFRVATQLLLLVVVIPSLFREGDTNLSPALAALMTVPVVLLLSSFFDARERKALTVLVTAEALQVKTDALDRIETALAENTAISQEASDHADAAYKEANSVNVKIATQGAAILKQGETMDADRAHNAASRGTIETTAEEVHDLHEGTAPEKAS